MKKRLCIIVLLVSLLFLSFGCKNNKKEDHLDVTLPGGIPAVGLGGLFDDDNYSFKVVDGVDLLRAELIRGESDVVIAPIILGAQLYVKDSMKYQLVSIITMGNSYIVSKKEDKINSLKDLEGQTIAAYGENTAPDIVLKAALKASGVDLEKITFVYENSVADAFSNRFIADDNIKYVLSAEPIITRMEQKKFSEGLEKIDLQELLKSELSIIPQAGIFVKKDSDKDYSAFLEKVNNNVNYLNNNNKDYTEMLLNLKSELKSIFETLGSRVIELSIPTSNITFMNAKSNKSVLDNYFAMVNLYNSNILNGQAIDESFYYGK